MQACQSVIILLVFLFQSVRAHQNAAFDKNYSDRLTGNNNQQSTLELAANKHYETSRFRRSNDGGSGSHINSDGSTETGPILNSGTITMPEDNDNDAKKPINFLRLYFCGPAYQNCMYDERLNNIQVQNDFLKQIPRMAEITLPTNYLDWKSKQLSLPLNIRGAQITKPPGRRDRGITADEPTPHYVLVRSDDANPRHLGSDIMDDPFIPQRGRRQSKAQTYDDPFYPMRGRRAETQAWDDPFFPMRGRRADKNANAWDDPFVPMRGRRRPKDGGKRAKSQPWDDPFIPMRGRRWPTNSIAYDDPFIPMRGRKAEDYDDVFVPMRGRRSIKPKAQRRKRSLLASTGTFNAVYTPSEEVIVKLNGIQDKNLHTLPPTMNRMLDRLQPNGKLIEGTKSHSVLNEKHQQHQKKSQFLLDDFATNPDDGDNGLMNDSAMDYYYYVESPQINKSKMNEYKHGWMKSSRDLSQNRDAGNLARGSTTSILF
ncbi:uncharacterized protein LOC116349381 isoform X2 [Contarinia nasturtii]|uniref:uncharacterized protein LOC116349381 isoform X2 n=1 Tax=Contarinia nasturtii TaxID=265458 RepID=UPI0012D4B337|nr:uncharacterized protein LOC116349381 isoform X2 [Contarinia nasturtii]